MLNQMGFPISFQSRPPSAYRATSQGKTYSKQLVPSFALPLKREAACYYSVPTMSFVIMKAKEQKFQTVTSHHLLLTVPCSLLLTQLRHCFLSDLFANYSNSLTWSRTGSDHSDVIGIRGFN